MKVLAGKPVAEAHQARLQDKMTALAAQEITIRLAIMLVGDDHGSHMYAKFMKKTAEKHGFGAEIFTLPGNATEADVIALVQRLSDDNTIHGILPMMPLPEHIDADRVLAHLLPRKDVDGLTVTNIGLVSSGRSGFWPCTPQACMAILQHYEIPIEGRRVVVIGRSQVVGRPVAMLLMDANGTVTICHSRTRNMDQVIREADIVIVAIGKAHYVTGDMLKPGAVVIDVGINELEGQTVGDVHYASAETVASAMTPVPGGVGSVTTTMMLEALYRAYELSLSEA